MGYFARWVVGIAATLSFIKHAPAAEPSTAPLQLRFHPQLVLAEVAQRLGVTLRPEIAAPAMFLESATPIEQSRDAISAQ